MFIFEELREFRAFNFLVFPSLSLRNWPIKVSARDTKSFERESAAATEFLRKKISIWKIRIGCSCHRDGSGQSAPNKLKKRHFSFESLNGGGNRHIPWNGRRIYARLSNKSCPSWRLTSTGQLGEIFGNLGLGRFSPRIRKIWSEIKKASNCKKIWPTPNKMQSRGQGFSNRVEKKKIQTLTSVGFYESPTLLLLLEKKLSLQPSLEILKRGNKVSIELKVSWTQRLLTEWHVVEQHLIWIGNFKR